MQYIQKLPEKLECSECLAEILSEQAIINWCSDEDENGIEHIYENGCLCPQCAARGENNGE